MDRIVRGVPKSWTRLSDFHFRTVMERRVCSSDIFQRLSHNLGKAGDNQGLEDSLLQETLCGRTGQLQMSKCDGNCTQREKGNAFML